MKFIIFLLFLGLICASSAKVPMVDVRPRNTINQHFIDFFHNERVNFPCGWPDSGTGPIEPFFVEEYNFRIESNSEFSAVDFNMRNAEITGHKQTWMNDFDLNLATYQITFDTIIPKLQISGDHVTSGSMLQGIVTVPISGQGRVNMNVNNVHVIGVGQLVHIPGGLHLSDLTQTVRVETVDASVTGFGILDGAVSRMISSVAPDMVSQSQEEINSVVGGVLIPAINNFINQHTLTTLLDSMIERNQNPPPRRCFW